MKTPTRRAVLALATALVAVAAAGCGGAPGDQRDDGVPSGTVPSARAVKDQYGTVTIEGTPKRVVTPGNVETDTAVALGVVPVAMGQWLQEPDGSSPWRRELLHGARPKIIEYNPDGYDVEETLAFRPDLVLAGFDLEENPYRQLSERVPTISMPYETSAEDLTRAIGKALNREKEADGLIAETREEIAEARKTYPQLDGLKISIVDGGTPGVLTEWTKSTIELGMLKQLGLRPAEGVAEVEEYAEVPAERWASTFDGDAIVVNFADKASIAELEKNKFFQSIPAVKAGRYLAIVDQNEGELLRAAALPQVQYSLQHFIPQLVAAVE